MAHRPHLVSDPELCRAENPLLFRLIPALLNAANATNGVRSALLRTVRNFSGLFPFAVQSTDRRPLFDRVTSILQKNICHVQQCEIPALPVSALPRL